MLRQVAEGVLIHQSELLQNNTVVVQGRAGVLLIDPGTTGGEMACLANDLSDLGQAVVAGASTHPDWDHVLWDARFGEAPRYGTARCAADMRDLLSDADWKARVAEGLPPEIAEEIPLDLFGLITGLPAGTAQIPWDGPNVRVIEHQAHAQGHAALLIEERGVLVAGDMLSDVLIPMLDLSAADPIEDYSPRCDCSRAWRATSMSSFRVTAPPAELIRCAHGSHKIGRTCRPCVTSRMSATRGSARRPSPAGSGWATCTTGRPSASPGEASATGRPASDRCAAHLVRGGRLGCGTTRPESGVRPRNRAPVRAVSAGGGRSC
ncbi:MBL fold metallo-hydrolase [Thermocatellispora tengchongensis]|uniref:MBL fold metallo-hydrolase n=1 Tax=Thermocatellispora tengchongensis TaxID=1073253 RepID=UPI0036352771